MSDICEQVDEEDDMPMLKNISTKKNTDSVYDFTSRSTIPYIKRNSLKKRKTTTKKIVHEAQIKQEKQSMVTFSIQPTVALHIEKGTIEQ